MTKTFLATLVLAGTTVVGALTPHITSNQQNPLIGTWKSVKVERDGVSVPFDGVEMKFSDRDVIMRGMGGPRSEARSAITLIDTAPKGIDIVGINERPMIGIFEVNADALKIALTYQAKSRPKDFAIPKGSDVVVFHLQRVRVQ